MKFVISYHQKKKKNADCYKARFRLKYLEEHEILT